MKKLFLLLLLFTNICLGQVNITPTYSQNFNTLTSGTWTDNITLPGWYARTDSTPTITTYGANTGSTTLAGLYAFGVAGTNTLSDRAIGYVSSNTYSGASGVGKNYLGCRLKNNTGSTISSITITWTGEQWRRDNSPAQSLNLSYQIGTTVTNLTTGTWTATSSIFTSPQISAAATALDGNNPIYRVGGINITIPVTIANGDEIMLRWEDLNDVGNDHQLAIDDVTISTTTSCTPPTISSISPTSGPVGTQVTITASSGLLLNATATIGGINATVLSSSTTQLVILIPSGATSGAISITDSQPCSTTTSAFTVTVLTPQCGYLTDLFMSQVTDASSGALSYVEIYNGTGSPVNLSNYSIKTANNGNNYGNTIILNNFILNNNSTYVVALGTSAINCPVPGGDGAISAVGTKANQSSTTGSIDFAIPVTNAGSDHIGLFNGINLIDAFGTYGSNSWASTVPIGLKGADFKRKNNATLPNTSFNTTDWNIIDWIDLPTCSNDEYSDVGIYVFTPPNSTTWDGSNWSNGTPTLSKLAIINGNYNTLTTNANIDACSLIVNSTFTLTITDGMRVTIQNDLSVFGTLNILNNGSLIQINDNGVNSGNITYNRNVGTLLNPLKGYDYVYWSSPVVPVDSITGNTQTMESIYTIPSMGFKYYWNTLLANSNGNGGNISQGNWSVASGNMTPGIGYIIRASSSFGWTGNLTATFTNKPNNGIVTTPIYRGNYTGVSYLGLNNTEITNLSDNYNLIGNPYPSAIKASDFLTSNTNIQGFVYLWTHGTNPLTSGASSPFYQSFQYNYTSNDYITHNGTATTNGPSGFSGDIASGQGFFVQMNDGATTTQSVIFKNSMRNSNNSQFYRTLNQKSRIWIDLVDSNFQSNRMVLGYVDDATNNRDRLYDAITTTNNKIYSIINNEPFIIQGRSLPFKKNDKVKIGINITTVGEYKIAIAEVDGLFNNQDIYLEDKLLNITHDLKLSPYTFTSNIGTFNNRFIIKYKTNNGNNSNKMKGNLSLYNQNNNFNLDSDKIIKNVRVYDITGKLLYDNNFNSNNVSFNLECSKQILLVKIKTDDDEIITKKISN